MKCPKCQYLGFETGNRCKNCGYDFSLLDTRVADVDVPLRAEGDGARPSSLDAWDRFESDRAVAAAGVSLAGDVPLSGTDAADSSAPLPLFALNAEDQPLVRLPAAPRRPLSVRRTPENPRMRAAREVPDAAPAESSVTAAPLRRRQEPDSPLLGEARFGTTEAHESPARPTAGATAASVIRMPASSTEPAATAPVTTASATTVPATTVLVPSSLPTTSPQRRCAAATIDYALLFGIDTAIIYFTVRMAGLDMSQWRLIPVVPLVLFLAVIALAYVGVFTAIGGQTIGKMAAGIRVVADDPGPVGATHAFKRTAAVVVSWLTGGLGFLPALVGDHRALHDRLSRTRVVDLT
jgi:uncharacterized RDD family membrane protein YckC